MTMTWTPELEAMVKAMLQNPDGYPWTLQGFGMLRCDLAGREYRLHVWDRRYRVDDVASIHDHPWDLESLVMAGRITNTIFRPEEVVEGTSATFTHWMNVIEPGDVGGELEPPRRVRLYAANKIDYRRTEVYAQTKDQIHDTEYVTGTVTLVRRTNRDSQGAGGDRAKVFWRNDAGMEWKGATPQEATPEKVKRICDVALAMWGEDIGEATDAV